MAVAGDPAHHEHFQPAHAGRESRARWVTALTLAMMVGELAVGWWSGSLALLADGWHMATHAGALGLAALAYWYAREHAASGRYTFGTGKVYALSGFASAVALAIVALGMAGEGVHRLVSPVSVQYGEALVVAVIGLGVNLVSAWLLGGGHDHDHGHGHDGHDHHGHGHDHHGHGHGQDQNLQAAYIHVLADALTSVLAIVALLAGSRLGWAFLDPLMGLVGGAVILRWSWGLARSTAETLLDVVPDPTLAERIRARLLQFEGVRIVDLHVWDPGPDHRACIVALVASAPRPVDEYRAAVLEVTHVDHLTVEVHGR